MKVNFRPEGRKFSCFKENTTRPSRGSKKAIAGEQNTNKKLAQDVFVPKAPLCKGSCRANARLRDCEC